MLPKGEQKSKLENEYKENSLKHNCFEIMESTVYL